MTGESAGEKRGRKENRSRKKEKSRKKRIPTRTQPSALDLALALTLPEPCGVRTKARGNTTEKCSERRQPKGGGYKAVDYN